MADDFTKLTWVTNFPRSIKGFQQRREGVRYVEGPAKPFPLTKPHHVGIYTDDPDYRSKPLIRKSHGG